MTPGELVAGFYELPMHIAVAHEVLGSDCSTQIGRVPARILAPGLFPAALTTRRFPRHSRAFPATDSEPPSTGPSPTRATTRKTERRACAVWGSS
jgi:hypothetical protein